MNRKAKKTFTVLLVVMIASVLCIYAAKYFFSGSRSDGTKEVVSIVPERGRWHKAKDAAVRKNFEEGINELFSLPYLQGYKGAPEENGITVYDKNSAHEGLNFYCSGHAPEATIMDMDGNILHRWRYDFKNAWPWDTDTLKNEMKKVRTSHFRRAHLYENGDILAIYDSLLMIKLDKDSNLLWTCDTGGTHHHMQIDEDGNIYALAKKSRLIPRINKNDEVFDDFILTIDPDGKAIASCSILDSFTNSSYFHILEKMRTKGELFHTNTIQIFDGRLSNISSLFKKGNVLISVLFLNTIAIVDLQSCQVVWALDGHAKGLWNGMHEPVLLENGNILIFDNNWSKPDTQGKSNIIEFNPFTNKIAWRYSGNKKNTFHSNTCGTNQRLPNGNTLITESDNGRAFEVTKKGKIVWEYINPHRAGENDELIATLFHVERIEPDYAKWLLTKKQK